MGWGPSIQNATGDMKKIFFFFGLGNHLVDIIYVW